MYKILILIIVVILVIIHMLKKNEIRGGSNFIKRTKHNTKHPLLYNLIKVLIYNKKGNALSLGTGAGLAERDLIKKGWKLTSVDRDKYSNKVMLELIDEKDKKKYKFIHSPIELLKLNKKYDLIFANNVIPFTKRDQFLEILDKLKKHTSPQGTIAFTLFGNNTDLVKKGHAWGISIEEIEKLNLPLIETTLIEQKNGKFEVYYIVHSN